VKRFRILIAVVALFILLAWVLGWSGLLAVRTIHVEGLSAKSSISSSQLISQSGIHLGDKMARASATGLSELKRKYPRIQSITLKRRWPSTVTLVVKEKNAIAAVFFAGTYQLYGEDGFPFAQVASPPKDLPVISGHETAGIKAAVAIYRSLPQDLAGQIVTLTARTNDLIEFTIGKTRITWGSSDDSATKIKVLRVLLKTNAKKIDVSAPLAPTTR
jgi:cell division protein FtsQ